MSGTIPPIPPPFGTSSGDPGSLNVNRVDMMPTTTDSINTSTTTNVSQSVVDENPINFLIQEEDSDSDIEEDQRTNNEFMANLNSEYHERALLANQERFYKRINDGINVTLFDVIKYGKSNGPLIYQLQRELNNVSQENLSIAAYFNKLKKCWDELHNLNGVPLCSCAKMQKYTCNLVDKFLEIEGRSKLVQFLMKLNDDYEPVRNQIFSMDPLPNVNKAYYIVQQVEKQKQVINHVADPMAFFANMYQNMFVKRDTKGKGELKQDISGFRHCTGCGQGGHTIEQCFEKIGYQDWYKGKKNKKGGKLDANVVFGPETPFDMGYENELQGEHSNPGLDQKLVAADLLAKEVVAIGKGSRCLYTRTSLDPSASPSTQNSVVNSINVFDFLNNPVVSNFVHHNVVNLHTLHARLGHLYVSKVIHLAWKTPFEILHGTPSYEALKTIGCLCYVASLGPNRDKFDPKGIRCVLIGQKGYKLYNLSTHEVIHSRDVVFQESVFPFKEPISTFAPSTVIPVCYPDLFIGRSARSTTTPRWLKDFLGPKSVANIVHQQPLYPLFTHDDFKDVPQNHIAFLANVFDFVKPVSYSQACTHKGWVAAMEKELAALVQNKTWELTNLPIGHKPITLKWNIPVVLIYVDDVLVTDDSIHEIAQVKEALDQKFTIKDMREAKHFLGIEVCTINTGTHLNQRKYILDLLQDSGLTTCKPNPSPLPTSLHLSLDKVTPLTDDAMYRRLVGRLLYLTITRPGISYAVQHLSQFVSAPKDTHMQAALYLLKYLKGTISKGLFYPVQFQLRVTGFGQTV
nr:hypothetical protein CTI12_AA301390 [Tanacetum cinerariifolium]